MLIFTGPERSFLERNELGRLATCSAEGMPHVVPVTYIFLEGIFLIAVDYGTKDRNILRNPKVALLVDAVRPNRGVMVQGPVDVYEKSPRVQKRLQDFSRKVQLGESRSMERR